MSSSHTGNVAPNIDLEEHKSVNGVNAKGVAAYGYDGTNLVPLKTDNTGALATTGGAGGTQYADGATQATPTGTVALGKDTSNVLKSLPLDAAGLLKVNVAAGGAGGGAVTVADGADVTLGAKADAKSTATDTTAITAMSVLKQISASVQAPPAQTANAGTNLNTSALAVESGGNLATLAAAVVNADATTDPTKVMVVAGESNDGTPQYHPLPEGTAGRSLIVEGFGGGTAVPVSLATNQPTLQSGSTTAVTQATGTNLHTVVDSGTITAVTSITNTVPTKEVKSATNGTATVAASATVVTLIASNANRLGATIYNDSASILYLKLGATASLTDFTVVLQALTSSVGGYYEVPFGFTGIITGIWSSASGNARVGELST